MTKLNQRVLSDSMIESQIKLEDQALQAGAEKYEQASERKINRKQGGALPIAERLMTHWHPFAVEALKHEMKHVKAGKPGPGRAIYGPILNLLPAHISIQIAIYEMLALCMYEPGGVKQSTLCYEIGNHIMAEIECKKLKRIKLVKRYRDGKKYQTSQYRELMKQLDDMDAKSIHRKIRKMDHEELGMWSRKTAVHTGSALLLCVAATASCRDYGKPEDFRPAFVFEREYRGHGQPQRKTQIVRLDDEVFDLLENAHQYRKFLRPRYMPMIVPPMTWEKGLEGGYIKIRKPLVTKVHPSHKKILNETKMPAFYNAINKLSRQPWKINERILDVACKLWEQGGGCLDIPRRENYPMPEMPPDAKKGTKKWKSAKRARWLNKQKNTNLKGLRVMFERRVSTATKMLEYDKFYLPHQVDFRGRCYPMPYDINPQCDDLTRSLMLFGEPGKVNAAAERRMKIQAATMFGRDRSSYEDRIAWADENADMIRRCASDPLNPRVEEYWQRAKNPWQFLATCMALDDDEIGKYIPGQIDGTCNGLQHYAAVGRDTRAAGLVNMLPANHPADTYSQVCEQVKQVVLKDAAGHHREASMIFDHVCRDIVKPTVMTNVYGVTMVGARKQIYEKLDQYGFVEDDRYAISQYLSRAVLQSIGESCETAEELMDWLKRIAGVALGSKTDNDYLWWYNPIGFPVVQRYMQPINTQPLTSSGYLRIYMDAENTKVKRGKQRTAFAPNVVHGLDSSHLYMAANVCDQEHMAMGAVHDSYWTHMADVDKLAKILRSTFVEMHQADPFEDLLRQFRKQYPDRDFPEMPQRGELDLNDVLDATYMFS